MGESKKSETPKTSWIDGLKAEFHKIVWLDKTTLVKQTTAGVITTAIVGVIIAVLDFIIQYGVDFLVRM